LWLKALSVREAQTGPFQGGGKKRKEKKRKEKKRKEKKVLEI